MSNPVPANLPKDSPWTQLLIGRTGAAVPASVPAAEEPAEEATPVQVKAAVHKVNTELQIRSIGLQFEIDQDTDKVIVKVVDRNSGEVIRQIPNEEVVRISRVMGEMPGLLVDDVA